MRNVGIAWSLNSHSGWGVYGYQIARYMSLHPDYRPVLLEDWDGGTDDPLEKARVKNGLIELLKDSPDVIETCLRENRPISLPVLHARGEGAVSAFSERSNGIVGESNHALTFFECAGLKDREREIYNRFNSVTAGSTWNGNLLREHGVRNVEVCFQGVDPSRFHPASTRGLFPGRFVIFSGGKMEFRKGQDIVLRAVSEFARRHDDVLLLCVWGNRWGDTLGYKLFDHSPYIAAPLPPGPDKRVDLPPWFAAFGLNERQVVAFNHFPHEQMPLLIREADVALFPNRCEGGTNLVAMETMACGVPTILSANTGHLDIVAESACLPLMEQRQVHIPGNWHDTTGWGESSIGEILAHLEFVYANGERAGEIAEAGARHMQSFTWDKQIGRLLQGLQKYGV
ncbi:glycosyltransferase family 4 protein [Nisaea acidiphila]|uniref:Glycosyltransferase family 4 protein n=1 Tax=Nisaea acidiphila TaxID=1862145 RepID=A0A9J7APU5_9PROT|nr:glycosyltransferase family 4 protein [Nisaea acidiphila]UUX48380.1 glycosyltransferase family 4 protein [Nisaea acidiphila]